MNFDLTPEQKQVRDVARDFAQAELGDKIAPFDERHEFPHAIVAKLGPLGFLGVPGSTTSPTPSSSRS